LPNEKRSYLLIDVSNSFTKFAFATKQRLGVTERVETARLSGASIDRLLRKRQSRSCCGFIGRAKKKRAYSPVGEGYQNAFL
jgi:hypothetical protein